MLKPLVTTVVGVTTEIGTSGVTITAMSKDGAGYQAGLRVGDVLLTVQGDVCNTGKETIGLLRAAEGSVVVAISRPAVATKPMLIGSSFEVVVTKQERTTVVGVTTESGTSGVTITDMSKDGAGYKAGLRVGDLLLTVNDEACTSPEQTSGLLLRVVEGAVRICVNRPKAEKGGLRLFGKR